MFEKLKNAKMNAEMTADDTKFWAKEFWTSFRNNWKKVLIAIPLIIIFLWWAIIWFLKTEDIVTVTGKETKLISYQVTELDPNTGKEVIKERNRDVYFVYTDKGAYQFKESPFFLQWEVADRFGMLIEGKQYKLIHYGLRLPYFDIYENIVDFELYTPEPTKEVKPKVEVVNEKASE